MKIDTLTDKEIKTIREIRNFLIQHGRTPSIRELMKSLGYRSPRSVSILLDSLIKKKAVRKKIDGSLQLMQFPDREINQTVNVPLVGSGSCGLPILAEENIEAYFPVSVKIAKPTSKHFFLRAKGDSMDEAGINDGDLVLFKQMNTANNGDLVVALIDEEATIKEYHCNASAVVLKPRSSNKKHTPIILTKDFIIQGVVITSISNID